MISLTFGMQATASIYYNNETKCSNVNANDILGNLYFYDPSEGASPMFQHSKYFVELIRPDFTFEEIGILELDAATDRMVYNSQEGKKHNPAAGSICLNYI